jgi:hypothetical protein
LKLSEPGRKKRSEKKKERRRKFVDGLIAAVGDGKEKRKAPDSNRPCVTD